MVTRKILVIVFMITLFGAGFGGYFLFYKPGIPQSLQEKIIQSPSVSQNIADLYKEREGNEFLTGDNLLRKGPEYHQAARSFFEKALPKATSIEERAHIEYKIALTYTDEDPARAIQLMKGLADTTTYPNYQRAYALQHAYQIYAYLKMDSVLIPVLFEGEPYQDFYDQNDRALSLRKFNEYAVSFMHVPISDTVIAAWYASALLEENTRQDRQKHLEYLANAETHLAHAETYIKNNENTRNNADLIPRSLINKAVIEGRLAIAGEEKYRNVYGESFRNAIERAEGVGMDAAPRNSYALYSLQLDDQVEWQQAQPLFDELIDNIDAYPGMKKAYANYRDPSWNQRDNMSFMAHAYPKFKNLLLTLGWTESDFLQN